MVDVHIRLLWLQCVADCLQCFGLEVGLYFVNRDDVELENV